ncbi:MAG: hypothetical protein K0S65_408 [Labilithrix sp.]|nr:hypothetical protein [Labilithrix sp.]
MLALLGIPSSEASAAETETETEPIVFEYTAPPDCPSAEDMLGQIAAFTTKWTLARPDAVARGFVLRIVPTEAGYAGRFDLRELSGNVTGRDVVGDRCEDVTLGLAIAMAIAIDPRAMGAAPPPAEPASPKKAPTPKESPRPPNVAVSIGGRGEANSAVSALIAVLDLYLELEWTPAAKRIPWFKPTFRGGFRQSFKRTNRVGQSEADISWSAGQIELCPSRFALGSRFSIEGCLGSNIGVLSAQARGIFGARPTRLSWFDYGGLIAARWQFHSHLYAETAFGAWFPLTRDRLRVEPDGVVTEAPFLGFSAGLGIGWRF